MSASSKWTPGYETTYVTRGEMSEEVFKTLKDKILKIIESFHGELVHQEDWGRRKLAYPIQKETRGRYTYLTYTGQPGVVAEVERNLRLQENVIRFLTVQLGKEFNAGEYLKKNNSDKLWPERGVSEKFAERSFERGERGERGDRGERGEKREYGYERRERE